MGVQHRRLLLLDTLLLGVVGALSAQLFMSMLRVAQAFFLTWLAGYQPPGLPEEGGVARQVIGPHGLWLIPLATMLGGLVSGVAVYSLAPEAEGHGTDTVVKAFHRAGGFIRARVAPLKMITSAFTIGSGGAAGREGPIALISAGVGSIYATLIHRTEEERRFLALVGMAAGLSAIFRSPIGTAFFAIEVLYGEMEFEAAALVYTMIASVVAYAFNGLLSGWQPLFQIQLTSSVPHFADYGWYVVLGATSGMVATTLPAVFYGLRDAFAALPFPPHVKPALGGLAVGLLTLLAPQVLGGGYGWIQAAMNGQLGVVRLPLLAMAKMVAFGLTVGSGGSGGVFAPSLYVGAMWGGFLAAVFHQSSAAFVTVGMAAVFSGAARVPIATLLMVTEMTRGYELFVPAALAVVLSYLIQAMLSSALKYQSLYEAQVPGRTDSPAHHLEIVQQMLRLLEERQIAIPAPGRHLDLLKLLDSGIPVGLPDGKQFAMGVLRPQSPWVKRPMKSGALSQGTDTFEIVAIMRRGEILLPHEDTVLRARDRVLVITTPQTWARLVPHFESAKPPSRSA